MSPSFLWLFFPGPGHASSGVEAVSCGRGQDLSGAFLDILAECSSEGKEGFLWEFHTSQLSLWAVTVSAEQQVSALTRDLHEGGPQGRMWRAERSGSPYKSNLVSLRFRVPSSFTMSSVFLPPRPGAASAPCTPSVSVLCSMNKYYVVWCSLLSDMKKKRQFIRLKEEGEGDTIFHPVHRARLH